MPAKDAIKRLTPQETEKLRGWLYPAKKTMDAAAQAQRRAKGLARLAARVGVNIGGRVSLPGT